MKHLFKFSLVFLILSLFAFNQVKSQSNQYLELNGYNSATSAGDYVSTPNASALIAGSAGVTMTGWFYSNALGYGQGLMGFRGGGVTWYMVTVGDGSKIEDRITNAAGTLYEPVCPSGTLIPNMWQHYAFVFDGTKAYLYVNATLVASIAATGTFSTNAVSPFILGWSPCAGYNFYYRGGIDEVSMWNKALTQPQIQNIMNNEIADTAQGLKLYYKCNQGVPFADNSAITKLHSEVNSPTYDGVLTNMTMTGDTSNFLGTVDTSSQVITFPEIPNKLITAAPFKLNAVSTSGLPITYTVVTGPATIVNGDSVHLTGTAGLVSIKASQPGNAQYDSATSVINTFTVVDPNVNVPIIEARHPLAGNVYMPTLSKIQLAAMASINYTDIFSVQSLSFKVDGGTAIPATDFQNGCYATWWLPTSYGSHSIQILSTNNYGAVGTTTVTINITATTPDTTVTAFTGVVNNDISVQEVAVEGVLPSFIGAFDTIIATLTVSCPPGGCGAWDYQRSVDVRTHEGNWFELIRYITPYGVPCSHKLSVTDYMSILCGKVSFKVKGLDNGYVYALSFAYKAGAPPHKYSQVSQVWRNNYDFGNYANQQPVSVFNHTFPTGTVASKIKLISTGHGGPSNTSNAAEFFDATHHIHINNVDSFAQHNWVTCNPNPDACSPQSGTWQYSRAGWCPGSIARPYDFDLTSYIPSNNVAIKYVLLPAYIDQCNPNNPACVNGTTCTSCSADVQPYLEVDCNLINFFDNPPADPIMQAVKEIKDFAIAVYPNPSNGLFNLTSNNKPENVCSVTIYNLMGNLVKEFQWNGESTTFNLSNNASGVYIMKVSNKDKVEIKKLMVR